MQSSATCTINYEYHFAKWQQSEKLDPLGDLTRGEGRTPAVAVQIMLRRATLVFQEPVASGEKAPDILGAVIGVELRVSFN